MAATTAAHGGFRPTTSTISQTKPPKPPPLHISTNPKSINPFHLKELYTQCNHSTHRFPNIHPSTGLVQPIEVEKLKKAIMHSSMVVSVFVKQEEACASEDVVVGIGGVWVRKMSPITPENGRLVGFGRCVSDLGLTASIYDVMVIPYLQKRGIGRMMVQRILRMLIKRDVYDIAALCSDKERPFFGACGFGDDILGSTTMMYSRAPPMDLEDNQVVAAGRKLLWVPPIWVEVCLISARGLRRTSSFLKLQWYAVGWIDPANKFCSNIDSSGNANPVWRTKFSAMIDTCERSFEDSILHVEVHSREPIFLRTKLLGTASILLKEFVDKYMKDSEVLKPIEEVGSFQLRAKNANKPQGFVDISIRISPEREEPSSEPGDHEGFSLDSRNGIILPNQYRNRQTYPPQRHEDHSEMSSHYSDTAPSFSGYSNSSPSRPHRSEGVTFPDQYEHRQSHPPPQPPITLSHRPETHSQTSRQYGKAAPYSSTSSYSSSVHESNYGPPSRLHNQPPISPSPPPPPANVGYIPTFLPRTQHIQPSYMNMPSSGAAPGRPTGHSLGMGLGAGTLAASAVIFGDDFLSGFDDPRGLRVDSSVNISINPPF